MTRRRSAPAKPQSPTTTIRTTLDADPAPETGPGGSATAGIMPAAARSRADAEPVVDTALAAAAGSADTKAAIGHSVHAVDDSVGEAERSVRRTAARAAGAATVSRTATAGTRPSSATRPSDLAHPPAGPVEALRPAAGPEAPEEVTPENVFPEGFLPSLDAASVPASAVTPESDPRTLAGETTLTMPAVPTAPPGAPMIIPPPLVPAADADAVIDGEARVLAPPATKMYRRRRRAAVLLFLVLAAVVLVVGQVMRNNDQVETAPVTPVGSALPPAVVPPPTVANSEPTAAATTAPARNAIPPDAADKAPSKAPVAAAAGGFSFTTGYGPVLGSTGTLRRFKVAVEKQIGSEDGEKFADEVDRVLGDPRSWIAGRQFRLQRVPSAAASEFTIYLATAGTSEKMCADGGLQTSGFTSCRLPGQVVINNKRWKDAVPDYDAPLAVYRAYALNHEVGHQLGHGHEACGGKGEPAPVMMQQTYGLKGCVANSWPYLSGKRYAGNPID